LNWLMLVIDHKRVSNQGITLNKAVYWSEEMVRFVGRDVIVRWDYWDIRSILVYDEHDRFICQAPRRMLQDPLVKLRADDISKRALDQEIGRIRRLEKKQRVEADAILERVSDVSEDLRVAQDIRPAVGLMDSTPLIPEFRKPKDLDDACRELADVPEPAMENPKTAAELEAEAELKRKLKMIGIE
jgi:hypothetical protein